MAFWVDDFPFPKVGYVNSLEGTCNQFSSQTSWQPVCCFNHLTSFPLPSSTHGIHWVRPKRWWKLTNLKVVTFGNLSRGNETENFGEERKGGNPLVFSQKKSLKFWGGSKKNWLGTQNVGVFLLLLFFRFWQFTWMWFEENTCPKTVSAQFLWHFFQLWVLRIRRLITKASLPLTCFEFMSLFTAPSFYSKEVRELLLVAKSTPQTSDG